MRQQIRSSVTLALKFEVILFKSNSLQKDSWMPTPVVAANWLTLKS